MKKKQYSAKEILQGMSVEIGFVCLVVLFFMGLTWVVMRWL